MKKLHTIAGLLGVLVFLLSGQVMRHHMPEMHELEGGQRMMFVSRHLYILAAALVNLMLGAYFEQDKRPVRRYLQMAGSGLLMASLLLLMLAFWNEPAAGIAGRSAQSFFGWLTLLGGSVLHWGAKFGRAVRIDSGK